jgi:hypothetical protein
MAWNLKSGFEDNFLYVEALLLDDGARADLFVQSARPKHALDLSLC